MIFEFKSKKFSKYNHGIWKKSRLMIQEIIRDQSPVQVGDDVELSFSVVRVSKITLMAVSSYGYPDPSKLSFSYEGQPLTITGHIKKNRNPVAFDSFRFHGKMYRMPSYNRVEIIHAHMGGPE